MVNYEIGFHVVGDEAATEHGRRDECLSFVEFCRRAAHGETLPPSVTVTGLDDYLEVADDPDAAAEFCNGVLADCANHLVRQQPVVQFVVDDIEHWNDEPVIQHGGDRIRLNRVFGRLREEGPNWYFARLNVTS